MKLALFDLDHTLIPFDSGMAWTRHLVAAGHLPAQAEDEYLAFARQYVAGALDLHAMHRACVAPLAAHDRATLTQWAAAFEQAMAPRITRARRALVQQHLDAGDLCAIVTATTRLIAEPFARLFGGVDLIATEAVTRDGRLTGEIDGQTCYRHGKPIRVRAWLAERGLRLEAFDESRFYSDSANDLPLLAAVTHPVAVHPDERLRAHALAANWPVIEPS